MDYSKKQIKSIFKNMINGFAYHKIITDSSGKPIDYIYLDINNAYEDLTGLKSRKVIGKSIKEVAPEMLKDKFDWLSFYGDIALNNKVQTIEQYSEAIGKWFLINAYSPKKGYFIVIFIDITNIKLREKVLTERNEELKNIYKKLKESEKENINEMKLLNSLHQKLIESEERSTRAKKLAKVGNWELNLSTYELTASLNTFNLLGIEHIVSKMSVKDFRNLVPKEEHFKMDKALEGLLKEDKPYDIIYKTYRENDGKEVYMHSVAEKVLDSKGEPISVVGAIQDVTNIIMYQDILKEKNEELSSLYEEVTASEEELRQQMETLQVLHEKLQKTEERYRRASELAKVSNWELDPIKLEYSPSEHMLEMIGLEIMPTLSLANFRKLVVEEDHAKLDEGISNLVLYNKPYDVTFRLIHAKTKEELHFHSAADRFIDKDDNIRIVGALQDITQAAHYQLYLKEKNEELSSLYEEIYASEEELRQQYDEVNKHKELLQHLAYYDALTDLPNRTLFFKHLSVVLNNAEKSGTMVAVLFFDMDNFKRINDTLGHDIGDRVLKEISSRIKKCLDEDDMIARLSGDEFAVFLQNIEYNDEIILKVRKIQERLKELLLLPQASIEVTTSIGIALYPRDGRDPEEILKHADTAMYKSKEYGKNTYSFFNYDMKEEMFRKIEMEQLMKKAIAGQEFVLHYQPQFKSSPDELRGFEALIRWNSPELGFISPLTFIPLAEETGMIIPIGEWVIKEVCQLINKMKVRYKNNNLIFSVNISIVQLRQEDFDELLLKYIHAYNINPACLELEITESMFIEDLDSALEMLNKIKDLGIRIALDDFGTGYSSLSYLKKIPINLLKIDKAFVDEISPDKLHRDLTEPIISLVHKLGIETLSEGIETYEQLNHLINVNCDNFQGYYLGKPVDEKNTMEIIKRHMCIEQM